MTSSVSSRCMRIGCSHAPLVSNCSSPPASMLAKLVSVLDDTVFSRIYSSTPSLPTQNQLCESHCDEYVDLFTDSGKASMPFHIEYDSERRTIDYVSNQKTYAKIPDRVLSIRPLSSTTPFPSSSFQLVAGTFRGKLIQKSWLQSLVSRNAEAAKRQFDNPCDITDTDISFSLSGSSSPISPSMSSPSAFSDDSRTDIGSSLSSEDDQNLANRFFPEPTKAGYFAGGKEDSEEVLITLDAKTFANCRNQFFTLDLANDTSAVDEEAVVSTLQCTSSSGSKDQDSHTPILISIEGNIGAGKTTLLRELRLKHPEWCFIDEPVDTWTSLVNEKGESLLEVFYQDKKRWSYTFQNCALLSRFKNIEGAVSEGANLFKGQGKKVYITERCLDTDNQVFAKMLHADGCIDAMEYDLYQRWFKLLQKTATPLAAIVYVDTDPEVCSHRIVQRARQGENGIPIEYLRSLHQFQEDWIQTTTVPTVRATEAQTVSDFVSKLLE